MDVQKFCRISLSPLFNFRVNSLGLRERRPLPPRAQASAPSLPNHIFSNSSRKHLEDEYVSKTSYSTKSFSSKSVFSSKSFSSSSSASSSRLIRTRRESAHQPVQPDYVVSEEGGVQRVVVFDCGRRTAKCFTISCSFPKLARRENAVVRLKSRVWNSTLVEDYPHVDSVMINTRARLELPQYLASQQMRSDDETTLSVTAFPDGLAVEGIANIPIWVMVVSIMAGLLVVIIISLILWKFGFFERKRVSDVTQQVTISKQYPALLRGDEYIS